MSVVGQSVAGISVAPMHGTGTGIAKAIMAGGLLLIGLSVAVGVPALAPVLPVLLKATAAKWAFGAIGTATLWRGAYLHGRAMYGHLPRPWETGPKARP